MEKLMQPYIPDPKGIGVLRQFYKGDIDILYVHSKMDRALVTLPTNVCHSILIKIKEKAAVS